MVNRITQFVGREGPPSFARAGDVAELQHAPERRWLHFLEGHVRRRPKLFLSLAFTLGVGLAWMMKRK